MLTDHFYVFKIAIKDQTDLPLGSASDLFGKNFSNPVQKKIYIYAIKFPNYEDV